MKKFEKRVIDSNNYKTVCVYYVDQYESRFICECGLSTDQNAHYWADKIVDELLKKFGEF